MKYATDKKAQDNSTFVPAHFILNTGLDGAPSLHLDLTLNVNDSSFIGTAYITQAIHPAPNFKSSVSGTYIPILTLGAPTPIFHGRGIEMATPLFENLEFSFQEGGDNKGRFKYRVSATSEWHVIDNANVETLNR